LIKKYGRFSLIGLSVSTNLSVQILDHFLDPVSLDALIHSEPVLDNLRFVNALKNFILSDSILRKGKSAGASDVFKSSCCFAVRALRDVFEVDISVL
jgi:hypothetical protein